MWKRETKVMLGPPATQERPAPLVDEDGWMWIFCRESDYYGEWYVWRNQWRADACRFIDDNGNIVPRDQWTRDNLVPKCPECLDPIPVDKANLVTELV